jgi:Fe-S cluster assembly protein SufD
VASQPRLLVVIGRGARASVVERHIGLGAGLAWTNVASDVHVGDDAGLDHVRLQLEGEGTVHTDHATSRQTRDSRYRAWAFDFGGRLARHDLHTALAGPGAVATLWGLYLVRGEQHVDHHTMIEHVEPHGGSREVYKGILDDRARTVFNGRIIVRRGAQKTDAKQSNPNLVLSNGALAHTRPQLEIWADDVKCTHGATVGRLDADAICYLRARGIPEPAARALLVEAFAGEVVDTIELEPLRELVRAAVAARLPTTEPRG